LTGHAASRPIGVFDSGVGGLTVLRSLINRLPAEDFVYLGDTARLPYGTKSADTVARYSVQAAEALMEYGIKALVVACNTASSVGLPAIAGHVDRLPVIGVIEPGARAACAASRSGNIVVIATEGTVRGGAYERAIRQIRPDARVRAEPAPLFVALAEEGLNEGPIAEQIARHYLGPLFGRVPSSASGAAASGGVDSAADTLVLGCTHFPMLAKAIHSVVGDSVRVVDSAATTAASVETLLGHAGLLHGGTGRGIVRLLATDGADRFARVGSRFLERAIAPEEVELIDL
jgi:glutamate racemase